MDGWIHSRAHGIPCSAATSATHGTKGLLIKQENFPRPLCERSWMSLDKLIGPILPRHSLACKLCECERNIKAFGNKAFAKPKHWVDVALRRERHHQHMNLFLYLLLQGHACTPIQHRRERERER
ncbi:unnamed protein product, partial [Vitis vinifera]